VITAADHELAVVTSAPAEVRATGRVAARARLLDDYVAALPAEPVRLRLDGDASRLRASCGRFTAGLPTANPDDFPATPGPDDGALHLEAEPLREAIARVAFAAAKDETRPVLRGLRCRLGTDGLSLAACDGFRIGRTRLTAPVAAVTDGGHGADGADRLDGAEVILPARAAAEFERLLAGAKACSLVVSPTGGVMALRVGDTTVFARLLEGPYPDVERAIPTGWKTRVRVETAVLRRAVGVTALFWTSFVGSPVHLEARRDTLRLSAEGPEVGAAQVDLPATVEGDHQSICLGTPYLADILAAVATNRVELSWREALAPAVVREVRDVRETGDPKRASRRRDAPDSREDLWVVMPMHLPEVSRAAGTTREPREACAHAGNATAASPIHGTGKH
jgi:DNA polymerase-3 subunit beta